MKFRYVAPCNSGMSLSQGEGQPPLDILLWQGKEYDLPEDNDHVKSLVAQGYLIPVEEPVKASKSKPVEGDNK